MVKPGPIIGLIIGILMAGAPISGMLMGEPSLSDPKGKLIGIGFIIFGAFMVIVNIIVLATGKENLLASSNDTVAQKKAKKEDEEPEEDEDEEDEEEPEEKMIRCRFCKKKYSSDYNGCPYCKKK